MHQSNPPDLPEHSAGWPRRAPPSSSPTAALPNCTRQSPCPCHPPAAPPAGSTGQGPGHSMGRADMATSGVASTSCLAGLTVANQQAAGAPAADACSRCATPARHPVVLMRHASLLAVQRDSRQLHSHCQCVCTSQDGSAGCLAPCYEACKAAGGTARPAALRVSTECSPAACGSQCRTDSAPRGGPGCCLPAPSCRQPLWDLRDRPR